MIMRRRQICRDVREPARPQHRALDDVGGGALHRRIDRGAFGVLAALAVARLDLGEIKAAAEQGLDIDPARGALARLSMKACTSGGSARNSGPCIPAPRCV
jgi:hypothetical protein